MIVYDAKRTTPYWAPGASGYLEKILPPDSICFEWGGGQSTKWLAERVPEGFVYTVENTPEWIAKTLGLTITLPNCMLIAASRKIPERYVDAVDRVLFPNVYLIDGYLRPECLKKTMERARKDDIIVCDDALDYCGHLKGLPSSWAKFTMPHPSAGKKITRDRGNSVLTHHAMTKETWIWQV